MSSWLDGVPGRLWLRFGAFLVLVFLVLVLVLVLFWFWVLVRAASGSSPRSFSFLCALLFALFIPYLILAPRSLPTRARSPSFFVHFRFLSVSVSGSVVIPPPPRVCLLKYPTPPPVGPLSHYCSASLIPIPILPGPNKPTVPIQHNTTQYRSFRLSVCLSFAHTPSHSCSETGHATHPPSTLPPSPLFFSFFLPGIRIAPPPRPPACLPPAIDDTYPPTIAVNQPRRHQHQRAVATINNNNSLFYFSPPPHPHRAHRARRPRMRAYQRGENERSQRAPA